MSLLSQQERIRIRAKYPDKHGYHPPKWRKPSHYQIAKFCENPRCRVKVSKEKRFCSGDCLRSRMTREELILGTKLQLAEDVVGLEKLEESVSRRINEEWLQKLPLQLKGKLNVRTAHS